MRLQRPLSYKTNTMRCNVKGYPRPEIWMTINGLNVKNISSVKFKVIRPSVGTHYQFVLTDEFLIGTGNYTFFARNKYGTSYDTWVINEPAEGENIYF